MTNRTPEELKKHYRDYQGKPEQIKKRAERNAARRLEEKKGLVHKGDNMDVDHKKMIRDGGTNAPGNLRVVSEHQNRGWERDHYVKGKK